MNEDSKTIWKYIIGLLILAWFPLFHHLDFLPIWNFDESRQAINALEMAESKDWILTTYGGNPDLWNTKPPLLIWMQVGMINLFGPEEWAIRLPSALAGLASVLLVFFFVRRVTGKNFLAFISALGLLTFPGFADLHGTRSGDFDSLLGFFALAFMFSLFLAIHHREKQRKWIWLAGISLALAALTKGIVIFILGPGILIYLIWDRQWKSVFINYRFYLSVGLPLIILMVFYWLREMQYEGYLNILWENEIGGRYLEVLDGHQKPFLFYIDLLFRNPLVYFCLLLPWIPFRGMSNQNTGASLESSLVRYLVIISISFILIMSFSQTKLIWYMFPIYGLISILFSYVIYQIYEWTLEKLQDGRPGLLSIILIIVFFGFPFRNTVKEVFIVKMDRPGWVDAQYGAIMKTLVKDHPGFSVIRGGYNGNILFYQKVLEKEGNTSIIVKPPGPYGISEKLLICENELFLDLVDRYNFEQLYKKEDCYFVKIISERNN